jgi:hypothetical protein
MYDYGIIKPVKVILSREMGKRENSGVDKPKGYNTCTYGNITMKPPV